MSNATPFNPYGNPSSVGENQPQGSQISTLTKIIFVLFIAFGVIGVFGGCFGAVNLVIAKSMHTAAIEQNNNAGVPNANEIVVDDAVVKTENGQEDMTVEGVDETVDGENANGEGPVKPFDASDLEMLQKMGQDAFPGASIVQGLLLLISAIASGFMAVGGIMGLQGRLTGLNITRNVSAFMSLFKVVETAIGAYIMFVMFDAITNKMFVEMRKEVQGAEAEQAESFVTIFMYVGFGLWIGYTLMLILFYLFCYLHTSKDSVRANFN